MNAQDPMGGRRAAAPGWWSVAQAMPAMPTQPAKPAKPAKPALAVVLAALLLSGCATPSPQGGFDTVERLSLERSGQRPQRQSTPQQVEAARARVAELLAAPLSAETAVQLALLNNRELQAAYAELGLAEADRLRAVRPANPSFSFGRLQGHGGVEIDRAVLLDLLGLLTLPLTRPLEQQRFEQAQLQAAHETLGVADAARKAFFDAVSAQQRVGYFEQVRDAAEASSELARRMLLAGNFNKLARMREQSFHSEATMGLARARHQALAAREALVRVLGLDAGQQSLLRLPERLPDLPASPAEPQAIEQTAIDQRLDVWMARRSTEALARSLGLTRATRFVNVLHAGYQNASDSSGEPRRNGYTIELELPLFDFGSSRVARAEAVYMQSLHRTAAVAVQAQSEVREAYSAYRTAYDLARHYRDEAVPLRQRISDEQLLRYNGMLASVFDLLADSRDQVATVNAAIEALRDHWVAATTLQTVMTGRSVVLASDMVRTRTGAAQPAAGH